MSCIILVTRFQKLPSAGALRPQRTINLQYWWPKVPWFRQIVVFQADYDEIELQKIITFTSPKNVTKTRHTFFPNLGPFQSKFLATPVNKYEL